MLLSPTALTKEVASSLNQESLLLTGEQVLETVKRVFRGKYVWNELSRFGNGKIIHEALVESQDGESNSQLGFTNKTVDAALV